MWRLVQGNVKNMGKQTEWLNVGKVTDTLKLTRDRYVWKVYAKEHGT